MAGFIKRNISEPDDATVFDLGEVRVVQVGEMSFGRTILEPGWRWVEHVGPLAGTPSCQFPHFMIITSGRMTIVMDDGTVHEVGPGDVVDVPPGHTGWVVGDEPVVIYDSSGIRGWGRPPVVGERILTSILFVDLVDSTRTASRMGDVAWRDLLSWFQGVVRRRIDYYRGRHISDTGDGVLAIFDSPGRALNCGLDLIEVVATRDLRLRVGVHTGEIEWAGSNIRGHEVHVAARVMAEAEPGEILVTEMTRRLSAGWGLDFEDRGERALKGVELLWPLSAVVGRSPTDTADPASRVAAELDA
ncbi:MAG TPA: adenylate/guanylate cyclase domain-containing protein [Acidimicrobiia bacterium]|nr:adenylate/guanylate cyclase domain-containing protein [Acidimicrobiia bacterium]